MKRVPTPSRSWKDVASHRQFFKELATKENLNSMNDWYKLNTNIVEQNGGSWLLRHYYNDSLIDALKHTFPEYDWKPWKFQRVSRNFWKNTNNQRIFFDWLSSELKLSTMDDWYKVSLETIDEHGGGSLLQHIHGNSLYKALSKVYPEYPWKPWMFRKVPHGFWKNDNNVREYLKWLAEQMGITKMSDWKFITRDILEHTGGGALLDQQYGLADVLRRYVFGDSKSNIQGIFQNEFGLGDKSKKTSKSQAYMTRMLRNIFPEQPMLVNYSPPNIILPDTSRGMEFDVYLPEQKVAFEYFGEQHYHYHFLYGAPDIQIHRDNQKKEMCAQHGITFIVIPYWWDRQKGSLLATIHRKRPDLISPSDEHFLLQHKPIPETYSAQDKALLKMKRAESLLEKNLRKGIELHRVLPLPSSIDPTGWHMYPKPDGIRCYYDSSKGAFFSQSGEQLPIPQNILESIKPDMPDFPVEGEFISTDGFNECWNAIQTGNLDLWKRVTFCVLDAPTLVNNKYEERMESIQSHLKHRQNALLVTPAQQKCTGISHLNTLLQQLEKDGADGVMLRKPHSYYFEQFSWIKKGSMDEDEALVIENAPTGFVCKLTNGKLFLLSVPKDKQHTIATDSVITFKCQGFNTEGIPKVPKFFRTRPDIKWTDLLQRQAIPYRVAVGSQLGGLPKCRGCKKIITDRQELRIECHGMFTPLGSPPQPAKYTFCLSMECLQRAFAQVQQGLPGVLYPAFHNKIGIPADLKNALPKYESAMAEMKKLGTEWIVL